MHGTEGLRVGFYIPKLHFSGSLHIYSLVDETFKSLSQYVVAFPCYNFLFQLPV